MNCKNCGGEVKSRKDICNKCYLKNYYQKNKVKMNKDFIEYYQKNKVKMNRNAKNYYQKNKVKMNIEAKTWRINNKERDNENKKKWLLNKEHTDINFKLKMLLGTRARMAITNNGTKKSIKTIKLIGCSVQKCREHLGKQFQNRMSWDNYGKWHIDHIIPCASFDLTKEENQLKCFNYKNLQPLWAIDNLKKGAKEQDGYT